MQEIEIVITSEGAIQLDVRGVTGPACLALTESLEQSLGLLKARQFKGEYYQVAEAQGLQQWLQQGQSGEA